LDNASKWPLNGTFDPNILRDLYNFCERTGKWKELLYVQSFSYLRTKPSLCTSCSPAQVLLASKPVSKPAKSFSEPPPDSEAFLSFDPANEPPPYQRQASMVQLSPSAPPSTPLSASPSAPPSTCPSTHPGPQDPMSPHTLTLMDPP
jgi:hypothetical protein